MNTRSPQTPIALAVGASLCSAGLGIYSRRHRHAERRQIEDVNRRLAAIVAHTDDAILARTPEGRITDWNRGAERLYGYTRDEAIGRSVDMLIPPELAGEEEQIVRRISHGETVEQHETFRVRQDGSRAHVSLTISPIRDASGQLATIATVARDVSERKAFEGRLAYLVDHDPLTGLYNRRRFATELERELARARRSGSPVAVLAIDLDHFKYINDTLGHSVGDAVISQAAEILHGRLRSTDVLARAGADEFVAILPATDELQSELAASSLIAAFREDCRIESEGTQRRVTASIGIAIFNGEAPLTAEELLIEADIAMHDAKESGRNRASLYSSDRGRHARMQAGLDWSARIELALEEGRFALHAQPILSLEGETAPRHELLLRMVGENGELIAPAAFLEVAERMNLIEQIDRWVVREACRLLATEQRAGRDVRLELNLSARSISQPDLASVIAGALEASGANAHGLCFEITETAAIVNVEQAKRFAEELAELGCEFALDDFGSGFASFYYLKHLPFDYLKIDGEFITSLASSRTDQLVVQSLVSIAKELGKPTIAEFVGDRETLELLRSYGVDYAQGFYVGTPKPLSQTDLARVPVLASVAV